MTQALGDIRSGLVLLMALAVSGAGWWLVVAESETLPGFICGVAGYSADAGAWSIGLLIGRIGMWLAMMLAMAIPVGVAMWMRAGRILDAAFLAAYAGTAACVGVGAAVAEWVMTSLGFGNELRSGLVVGASFAVLGAINIGAVGIRQSASCMQGGGWLKSSASRLRPLLPSGEKCRASRGDEGVTESLQKKTPSSDPSGHLLPAGEKREPRPALLPDSFLHGLHQGRASLTCSITMVSLQFALGTMSLLLMIAMTLWMLAEALFPERRELPMTLGAALIMAGLSIIAVTSVT